MTPDSNQPTSTPFDRPSARAASSMPVQRGNYGIPPRQPLATPMPTQSVPGPRSMDIMAPPRPAQPSQPQPVPVSQPIAPTPVTPQQPVTPSPTQSAPVAEQIAVTAPTPQPLYSNRPSAPASGTEPAKGGGWLSKLRFALLIVGALLVVGGTGRWLTAGSTSGDLIAAAAVAANDGNSMTIQFTANDGQMHKFTTKSDRTLIPGSAVQVAYRSGAPDTSAKRVEPIAAAHSLGVSLMITGAALLLTTGVVTLFIRRQIKHPKPASIAKPVTV